MKQVSKTKAPPTGISKWLSTGGPLTRWMKEFSICLPFMAIMVFWGFFRYSSIDFSWFRYLGFTVVGTAITAFMFAKKTLAKYPQRTAVLDPKAPEFGAPIEPK
jgi:hypothetical protein